LAAACLAAASAAAADILVVRALGPSAKAFPPGRRLPDAARITLKANDQLVVLDGRGTRTIRGPGTFTAGARAPVQSAAAVPVTRGRARIGAVRGPGDPPLLPPTLWHVDIDQSSNVCVADAAKLMLWRADAGTALNIAIAGPGGRTRRLLWPNGSTSLAWPADLPVTDGAEYRLSWSGAAAPTTLRFRTVSKKPAELDDIAQTLIRHDCQSQLDTFIETVKLPESRAPTG